MDPDFFDITDADLDYFNISKNDSDPTISVPVMGPRHAALLVFYGLVCLLGVPGNALVVWVTGFRMPSSVTSMWFLNLALADLLCCLSLPLLMVAIALDENWPFGQVACSLVKGVLYLFMYCSVLLLVLISLDRWLLVNKPVWCQNRRSPRQATWVCVAVWFLALLGSIPQFVFVEVIPLSSTKVLCLESFKPVRGRVLFSFQFLAGFLLPFLTIVACHFVVYRRAGRPVGTSRTSSRTLRVTVSVALSFFLCWLPLHVMNLVKLETPLSSSHHANVLVAQTMARCLAYFNSCLNPMLYACLGKSFKSSMSQSLRSMFHFISEEPGVKTSISKTQSTVEIKEMAL